MQVTNCTVDCSKSLASIYYLTIINIKCACILFVCALEFVPSQSTKSRYGRNLNAGIEQLMRDLFASISDDFADTLG